MANRYLQKIGNISDRQYNSKKPHVDVEWQHLKAEKRRAVVAKYAKSRQNNVGGV